MKKTFLIILGIILMACGAYGTIIWWWPFVWHLILAVLGPVLLIAGLIVYFIAFED